MYNKSLSVLFISALPLLFFSCALIWLGDLELEPDPSEPEQIFGPEEYITVRFSEEPDRFSFESIFSLAGPDGDADGDFLWETDSVVFAPHKEMQPGHRYRMQIFGDLKTADGRSFTKYIDIPFYYQTDELPPVLVSTVPDNTAIVDVDNTIVFSFSKPIDRNSFDDGFTLRPSAEFDCSWNENSTVVTITPDNAWINLCCYNWSISPEVTDEAGIPLPRKSSGSFLVQADTDAPSVTGIYPAGDNADGSYSVLTALSADDLLLGQHLALTFSESIDFSSLRRQLSLTPSIDGYIVAIDPQTALYYIDEELPPDQEYELIIEEGLMDTRGNSTTSNWSLYFTPSIPAQEIVSVEIEDNIPPNMVLYAGDFNNDGYITIPNLDYYGTDTLYFYVNLAEGFPSESINERREFVSCISLSPVFPPGTAAPSLYSSAWESETRIRLIYEDLASCSVGEPVYYRFRITAGSSDSAPPGGSYLLDAISFIFLAEEE